MKSRKNIVFLFIMVIVFWLTFCIFGYNLSSYFLASIFMAIILIVTIFNRIKKKYKLGNNTGTNENIDTNTNTNTISTNSKNIILKCNKCGNTVTVNDKFCTHCGEAISDNNIKVTLKKILKTTDFDSMYLGSDNTLLENFIKRELTKLGMDNNTKLIPSDVLKRKNILNIIFCFLTYVYVCLIFFHFPILVYIIGLIILFIFYRMSNKYDFIEYLKKCIIERPSEKISNIIMSSKVSLVEDNSIMSKKILIVVSVVLGLILFYKPHIMYEKVAGGYAVRFYTYGLSNFDRVTIPETYKGEKVVGLRGNTFSNMFFLKKVSLPDTITFIRGQAFKNCFKLKGVDLPKKLEYLGGGSFYNAKSLERIVLPDSLTYLGGESFYNNSSLVEVKLSNNLQEIRGDTFSGCNSLLSIEIPDSVTRIGGHAFYENYKLNNVVISSNSKLQSIGSSAFRRCYDLYEITIPENTSVNYRAFKESPTVINRYISQSSLEKHILSISTDGSTVNFYSFEYGNIYIYLSDLRVIDNKLYLNLNITGGINESKMIPCDGSTTHISDTFYVVPYEYSYVPSLVTFNFYYY